MRQQTSRGQKSSEKGGGATTQQTMRVSPDNDVLPSSDGIKSNDGADSPESTASRASTAIRPSTTDNIDVSREKTTAPPMLSPKFSSTAATRSPTSTNFEANPPFVQFEANPLVSLMRVQNKKFSNTAKNSHVLSVSKKKIWYTTYNNGCNFNTNTLANEPFLLLIRHSPAVSKPRVSTSSSPAAEKAIYRITPEKSGLRVQV